MWWDLDWQGSREDLVEDIINTIVLRLNLSWEATELFIHDVFGNVGKFYFLTNKARLPIGTLLEVSPIVISTITIWFNVVILTNLFRCYSE